MALSTGMYLSSLTTAITIFALFLMPCLTWFTDLGGFRFLPPSMTHIATFPIPSYPYDPYWPFFSNLLLFVFLAVVLVFKWMRLGPFGSTFLWVPELASHFSSTSWYHGCVPSSTDLSSVLKHTSLPWWIWTSIFGYCRGRLHHKWIFKFLLWFLLNLASKSNGTCGHFDDLPDCNRHTLQSGAL